MNFPGAKSFHGLDAPTPRSGFPDWRDYLALVSVLTILVWWFV